ncbi:META domain-containing protein [Meridianimaribacter sp. CL38]|uniref:META domain-containing protein n=1 Tax=Flavobacteriaceae TaxID=49546 RepID=UPI00103D323A|nr:META domain-containing protein [Meridianimaribacter sp. CL38]TBV26841.1 META domain-containing protein [Meridianimaribacter sp. CL38]
MKKLSFVLLLLVLVTACNSSKSSSEDALYNTQWELEHLSGPRIAFEGLFPDKKPQITFNKEDQKVTGNSGCNGYSASVTIDGNSISFGEPGPATMMYCGEGENHFKNIIKKVNAYTIDEEGKLHLLIDDVTMMRFKSVTP